nr:collagen alpha-1(X) chain-like [Mirounga angustirostris]
MLGERKATQLPCTSISDPKARVSTPGGIRITLLLSVTGRPGLISKPDLRGSWSCSGWCFTAISTSRPSLFSPLLIPAFLAHPAVRPRGPRSGAPRPRRAVPGNPGLIPPQLDPPGAVAPPLGTRADPPQRPPPAHPTSRPGTGAQTPTPNSPPGRKQEGGSRGFPVPPTGRPQPRVGLRKSRGRFPAAPLLCGSRHLDFEDWRGREGGGERRPASRGAAGEAAPLCGGAPAGLWRGARDRRFLPGRRGQRGGAGGLGPSAFTPDVSQETAPLPCWSETADGGPRWVMYVAPGNRLKSGGKKGVGLRKPPEVKDDETTMRMHLTDPHYKELN